MAQALLDCYRAIEQTSERMLAAACKLQWTEMRQIEELCARQISELKWLGSREVLEPGEKAEKTKIMLRILAIDAQIRSVTEHWLEEIDASFNSGKSATLH